MLPKDLDFYCVHLEEEAEFSSHWDSVEIWAYRDQEAPAPPTPAQVLWQFLR